MSDTNQERLPNTTRSEDIEEVNGYEDPFVSFSWPHWLELQTQAIQRFSRFQRAIAQRQPKLAMLLAIEMQDMALEMQKEACEWAKMTTE